MNNDKKGNAFDLGSLRELKLNDISGLKKAAILFIALGPEVSQNILKFFPEEQVQLIGEEIVNIDAATSQERTDVLKEFIERNKAKDFVKEGGYKYAKTLLTATLGEEKANSLLNGIEENKNIKPFAKIKEANSEQLYLCIKDESPQTIAIVLSNLDSSKASQVLLKLPDDIQSEVIVKIGTLDNVPPIAISTVEETLNNKLSTSNKTNQEQLGGVNSLVGILGQVGRRAEKSILAKIEEEDPLLAEQVKASMFVFEDIMTLDDRTVQRILRDVDIKTLSYALKGTTSDENSPAAKTKEIIFANQSKRAAETLKDEIELLGPVQVSEVENAQQEIVNIIKTLEESGEIKIVRGTQDVFIQ